MFTDEQITKFNFMLSEYRELDAKIFKLARKSRQTEADYIKMQKMQSKQYEMLKDQDFYQFWCNASNLI